MRNFLEKGGNAGLETGYRGFTRVSVAERKLTHAYGRFFWLALYAQPALWVGMAILALVKLAFIWLCLIGESGALFSEFSKKVDWDRGFCGEERRCLKSTWVLRSGNRCHSKYTRAVESISSATLLGRLLMNYPLFLY